MFLIAIQVFITFSLSLLRGSEYSPLAYIHLFQSFCLFSLFIAFAECFSAMMRMDDSFYFIISPLPPCHHWFARSSYFSTLFYHSNIDNTVHWGINFFFLSHPKLGQSSSMNLFIDFYQLIMKLNIHEIRINLFFFLILARGSEQNHPDRPLHSFPKSDTLQYVFVQ